MSLIAFASIIGQPFWGNFIDTRNSVRNVIIICILTSGLAAMLIPVLKSFFFAVVIIGVITSFTESSMQSVIDSWTMSCVSQKPWIDYGLTRGLGSLGYAVTAVLFGMILDRYGYDLMFSVHLAMGFITIIFCIIVDRSSRTGCQTPVVSVRRLSFPLLSIAKSPHFVWFLISSTIIHIGYRASGTFFPLLLSQKGGNSQSLGLALFIMAASEVPVLFLSKKLLSRFKDTSLLTVSMGFYFLRILLHIFVPAAGGLIALQLVQGLSYGIFLPASVHYIKRLSPVGMSATFITTATSAYLGISGILGSFLGGLLIDSRDIYYMLSWGSIITLAGLLIFILAPKEPFHRNDTVRKSSHI